MTVKKPGLRHLTRAEAAADEIRRRILSGQYLDGHPLRQDALATELGIMPLCV